MFLRLRIFIIAILLLIICFVISLYNFLYGILSIIAVIIFVNIIMFIIKAKERMYNDKINIENNENLKIIAEEIKKNKL